MNLTSINQPFFVIKNQDGTRMIYREESIKNLMNNSVVRYNDPAVLEVSLCATVTAFVYFDLCKESQNANGDYGTVLVLLHVQRRSSHP